MIAIQNSKHGFHPAWISYCEQHKVEYKTVNCYANDIMAQLADCSALLWHHSQGNPKDILVAKQILNALQHKEFKVFPNCYTNWHFDDKVGQKYLLEAIGAPLVPSYVFLDKYEALTWVEKTTFPKVWKLRGGAGSANVKLVNDRATAKKLIAKAFHNGFKSYSAWSNLEERWRKYRKGKTDLKDLGKGIARLMYEPRFSKINGAEIGYVYFQDFIPDNDSDTRVIVIADKAFALKRMVRENDFRASGSGEFRYGKEEFDERCVEIAFQITSKLKAQCLAYDFIFDQNNQPLIVEVSYGFSPAGYYDCPGYWTSDMQWHIGRFDPCAWMVQLLLC